MEPSPSLDGSSDRPSRKQSVGSTHSSASGDSSPTDGVSLENGHSVMPKYFPRTSFGGSLTSSYEIPGRPFSETQSGPPSRAASTGELWTESDHSPSSTCIYPSTSGDDVSMDNNMARRETFTRRSSNNDQWKSQTKNAVYRPRLHTTGDMVNARMMHSAVLWEDFMFVFGGICIHPALRWDDIRAFHFATRTWSDPVRTSEVRPRERFGHTAVVYSDSMWVFGGEDHQRELTDEMWEFDFEEQIWRAVDYNVMPNAPIAATSSTSFMGMLTGSADRPLSIIERPGPRTGHTAVIWDKCMYLMGGLLPVSESKGLSNSHMPSESTNEMWQFDFVIRKWSRVQYAGTTIIPPRHFHSSAVIGDSMYVFGGKDGSVKLGDFWEFKFTNRTWNQIITPINPGVRSNHVSVVVGDNLYICGGKTDDAEMRNIEIFEFDFMFRKWYKIDTKSDEGLLYYSAVSRNGNVFFFGGVVDGEPGRIVRGVEIEREPAKTVNELSYICLGGIDYQEEIEMDEISKVNALPKSMWEAAAMKRHPNLLALTEKLRPISKKKSYGLLVGASRSENKSAISSQSVLQIVMEYLKHLKMDAVVKTIQEESSEKYVEKSSKEPIMLNLLRVAHRTIKGRDTVWSHNLQQAMQEYDMDPEVVVVDHLRRHEEVEQLQSSWDEPDGPTYIQREESVEDKPGMIRLGTLNKLIADLTTQTEDDHIDMEFSRMFFSVYTRFTSSMTLLEKLIERYDVEEELLDDEKWEQLPGTKARVCQVVQLWVDRYGWDFTKSENLNARLRSFIEGPLSRDGNVGVVKQLKTSMILLQKKKNAPEELTVRGITPPEVKLPKFTTVFTEFNLNSVDEIEMARQLTIIDFHIFSQIQPSELYRRKWMDSDQCHLSPHVTQLSQRSDAVTSWVALSIISGETKRHRVRSIERFIKIADNLYRLKNFHTHSAVVKGLSNNSVASLTQTIQELSPKARTDMEIHISYLNKEMGFKGYTPADAVRLPPLEHILNDINAIEESQPDEIAGLINFAKCRAIYESVGLLQSIQGRHYNLQPVIQITKPLLNLPPTMTNQELEEMAFRIEPRRYSVMPPQPSFI